MELIAFSSGVTVGDFTVSYGLSMAILNMIWCRVIYSQAVNYNHTGKGALGHHHESCGFQIQTPNRSKRQDL